MNLDRGLVVGILLAMAISSVFSFYRFYLMKQYVVYADVECDPLLHSCFAGDGVVAPESYAVVIRPAYTLPHCNAWAGECPSFSCDDGAASCVTTYCSPEDGDSCLSAGL